ncbi:MAG: hypothetical protein PSV22_00575 [Pseudolabrys sp.]|nr:hypothetical protein [Pseudolabrys sp.]
MASLYANIMQVSGLADIASCFDLVTTLPARLMNLTGFGIAVGRLHYSSWLYYFVQAPCWRRLPDNEWRRRKLLKAGPNAGSGFRLGYQ